MTVTKLDRLPRDVAFISDLIAQRVPYSSQNHEPTPIGSCCTSTTALVVMNVSVSPGPMISLSWA